MYIVVELQTTAGTTANIVTSYATRQQAESAYHSVLSAAAISQVEVHAAVILTPEGFPLMHQAYLHPANAD